MAKDVQGQTWIFAVTRGASSIRTMASCNFADDWMRLISVAHVRIVHDPAQWAEFDLRTGYIAIYQTELPLWFNAGCLNMCEEQYGKLRDFDESLAHRYSAPGFPRAFQTIQAQHELLYTLKDILQAVIGDSVGTGDTAYRALVTDGLHSAGQDVPWNAYMHQPFTIPVHFSPHSLHRKAQDRLQMIKDELLLMQTDPAYTQEIIRTKRIVISNISSDLRRDFQTYMAGGLLMMELLTRFQMWQTITSRCLKLVQMFEHYGPQRTSPGMIMPREITLQLSALEELLQDWFRKASSNFEGIMHSAHTWQQRYRLSCSEDGLHVSETKDLDPSQPVDRLRYRVETLRNRAAQGWYAMSGYGWLFEVAEREELKAGIMDKPTRDYMTDMMLVDDIRVAIVWRMRGDGYEDLNDIDVFFQRTSLCCVENDLECRAPALSFGEEWFQRTGDLMEAFMAAAWPKGRKDLTWLAKATECRTRLASLLKGVSEEFQKADCACGEHTSTCGTEFTKSAVAFATDSEHLAMLDQERIACEAESARLALAAEENARKLQDHIIQSEWGSTDLTYPVCRKQAKRSTRTQEVDSTPALQHLAIEEPATPVQELEQIAVKKESLAVFQKMYRGNMDSMGGGSIRWPVPTQIRCWITSCCTVWRSA
ncbi:hypothetical protein Slin14017_G103870 [Septoria linicola]|nr:hypothetical protein Slin14017_G103870 [Septoria linicola]